jgi:hypothetical protein
MESHNLGEQSAAVLAVNAEFDNSNVFKAPLSLESVGYDVEASECSQSLPLFKVVDLVPNLGCGTMLPSNQTTQQNIEEIVRFSKLAYEVSISVETFMIASSWYSERPQCSTSRISVSRDK